MARSLPILVCGSSFITRHTQSNSNRSNLNNMIVLRAPKFVAMAGISDRTIVRRSANYHPPIWEDDYIQSLKSGYLAESYKEQAMRLVGEVRMMLEKVMNPLEQIELIDTLQRLGLSYRVQNEINKILKDIRTDQSKALWNKHNLYATSLGFRLLRHSLVLTRHHARTVSAPCLCQFNTTLTTCRQPE